MLKRTQSYGGWSHSFQSQVKKGESDEMLPTDFSMGLIQC